MLHIYIYLQEFYKFVFFILIINNKISTENYVFSVCHLGFFEDRHFQSYFPSL